ncbi:MAG: hypothetical protein LBK42_03775 [Propionibacteriaceae bacterium]|jgi:hypothetical protein|nr:hypothetical protein [Propionibacteriaceae bacterium]
MLESRETILPTDEQLAALPIIVERGDEVWVRNITANVGDHDKVLIWLEPVGQMVDVQWLSGGRPVVVLSLLEVVEVTVSQEEADIVWLIKSDDGPNIMTQATVRHGNSVTVDLIHTAVY